MRVVLVAVRALMMIVRVITKMATTWSDQCKQVLLDTGSSGPTSPSISSAADAQVLNPSQGHSDNNVPLF